MIVHQGGKKGEMGMFIGSAKGVKGVSGAATCKSAIKPMWSLKKAAIGLPGLQAMGAAMKKDGCKQKEQIDWWTTPKGKKQMVNAKDTLTYNVQRKFSAGGKDYAWKLGMKHEWAQTAFIGQVGKKGINVARGSLTKWAPLMMSDSALAGVQVASAALAAYLLI